MTTTHATDENTWSLEDDSFSTIWTLVAATYLSTNIISIRGVSCGSEFSFHFSISFFICKNTANLTQTSLSHPSRGVSNDVDQRSTILFVYITIKCNHWHPKWRPPGHQRHHESSERFVLKRSLKLLLKLPLIDSALRKHKKVESFVSGLLQSTVIHNYMLFMFFSLLAKNNLSPLFVSVVIVVVDFKMEISCYLNSFILIQEEFLYYSCKHFVRHYSI